MLDILIYKIGFTVLLISVFRRHALLVAVLLCVSFIINEITFIDAPHPLWSELEHRYTLISIKDALIMVILYSRIRTLDFLLGLCFAASGIFHQIMIIQIHDHILTLKHIRTDFMVILTAVQLAIVIFMIIKGSGENGGKRVKYRFPVFNSPLHRFYDSTSYKAKP